VILPGLFAQRYGRIHYLDADVTIQANESGLFALDLGDQPLAANRLGTWPLAAVLLYHFTNGTNP